MESEALFARYRDLQRYVGWSPADEERVRAAAPIIRKCIANLVRDFYEEIERHPQTRHVIQGGQPQVERLKESLTSWLEELFSGKYDADYVSRRWQIGLRHVQIGLNQVYLNAAMSRLRSGILSCYERGGLENVEGLLRTRLSIDKLIDLDLAIIEDAYQTEFLAWQNREERQKLLQAERLAAIGQTMTGLIHESRNASQRCRACLEMLSVEIADRPAAIDLVQRAQSAQNDLHQLFEEVREYAAPITLQRKNCNLAETLREAWHDLAGLHQAKDLRLTESATGANLQCNVDRFALKQVFRNVLENAIQASPKGDQISIAFQTLSRNGEEELQITVRDHGRGIPAELRSRVFEPFFTTKAKGTGLGLAIAQRIVQSHGGRIDVNDCQPCGAEILISLPRGSP